MSIGIHGQFLQGRLLLSVSLLIWAKIENLNPPVYRILELKWTQFLCPKLSLCHFCDFHINQMCYLIVCLASINYNIRSEVEWWNLLLKSWIQVIYRRLREHHVGAKIGEAKLKKAKQFLSHTTNVKVNNITTWSRLWSDRKDDWRRH